MPDEEHISFGYALLRENTADTVGTGFAEPVEGFETLGAPLAGVDIIGLEIGHDASDGLIGPVELGDFHDRNVIGHADSRDHHSPRGANGRRVADECEVRAFIREFRTENRRECDRPLIIQRAEFSALRCSEGFLNFGVFDCGEVTDNMDFHDFQWFVGLRNLAGTQYESAKWPFFLNTFQ